MTFVVVVADKIDEQGLAGLLTEGDVEVVSTVGNPDELPAALRRAHALLVRSSTQVTEDVMAGAPRLRVVGRAGIGVDNIDVDAATRRGIAVINAPGANTVSAAEHTIAMLLTLVRKIPWAAESMRKGEWERSRFAGMELRGKTLGLLGVGRIGAHVASLAQAFGMTVIGYDPFLPPARARQLRVELGDIEVVLRRADVISLHAPLNDETRGLLNRERLALVKPTAVVINTARGGLIDDEALVEAVEADKLAGAALDVFDPEPLMDDSPLRRSDKILLTPHLAASTHEAQVRVAEEVSRSVLNALRLGDVGGAVNVPGVSSEVLSRARSSVEVARRVGEIAGAIARGTIQSIEVNYGGRDDGAPKPVMLAAVEGVLRANAVKRVSLINASLIAEDRRIAVSRRIGGPEGGFDTTVGVTVVSETGRASVVGAVLGERGRVIRIDDYEVEVPAEGDVLILKNRDVPGVIGRVGTALGEGGVNIAFYHQSRQNGVGTEALAAIALDQRPGPDLLGALEKLQGVLQVVSVSFDELND